jgi:hypothetical protein
MAELPVPGPGRDSEYDPSMNDQVRKLALLGLTNEELAEFFGVHVSTFYRWQAGNSAFREAVNEGKTIADANVADSFYKRATGEHVQLEKIVKRPNGEHEVIKYMTYIPGDPGAALNWLKNRRGQSWRDKQSIDVTFNHEDALDELK